MEGHGSFEEEPNESAVLWCVDLYCVWPLCGAWVFWLSVGPVRVNAKTMIAAISSSTIGNANIQRGISSIQRRNLDDRNSWVIVLLHRPAGRQHMRTMHAPSDPPSIALCSAT